MESHPRGVALLTLRPRTSLGGLSRDRCPESTRPLRRSAAKTVEARRLMTRSPLVDGRPTGTTEASHPGKRIRQGCEAQICRHSLGFGSSSSAVLGTLYEMRERAGIGRTASRFDKEPITRRIASRYEKTDVVLEHREPERFRSESLTFRHWHVEAV
jgi:hypothetical protein